MQTHGDSGGAPANPVPSGAASRARVAYRRWLRLWTLLTSYELARGSTTQRLAPVQLRQVLPAPDGAWFAQPWNQEELEAAVDRLVDSGFVERVDDECEVGEAGEGWYLTPAGVAEAERLILAPEAPDADLTRMLSRADAARGDCAMTF